MMTRRAWRLCMLMPAVLFIVLLLQQAAGAADIGAGSISGRVVENVHQGPVAGATVRVMGRNLEATTGLQGEFTIAGVPPGAYDLAIEAERYKPGRATRIEVREGGTASVVVTLQTEPPKLEEEVQVVGELPKRSESQPGNAFTLTGTQLTTISGTMGDFGRTLRTVPAAAGTSDERNAIVARGGNPDENGFFIDDIEVPNISHLPDFGSTGGLYSIIDPSAVGAFDFIIGEFPAKFGGFMSSITDIAYREGSREGVRGQARFDIAMAGAALEGPLPAKRGSWRVSARHADFTFLKEVIALDEQNPRWTDAHAKVVYDLSSRHRLSLIDVLSSDRTLIHHGGGDDDERTIIDQNTVGLNWKASWSDSVRSETTVSHSLYVRDRGLEYRPPEDQYNWADRWRTEWYAFRNENAWSIGSTGLLQAGFQMRRYTDEVSYLTLPTRPGVILISTGPFDYLTTETAGFVSASADIWRRFRPTIGVRAEHSSAGGRTHVSPRASVSIPLNDSWQIHGAADVVYQGLPTDFLAINPSLLAAPDMRVIQYSTGVSFAGRTGWSATLEAYDKHYSDLPFDANAKHRLILDREPFRNYQVPVSVVSTGTGRSRGLEMMIERRAGRQLTALLSVRISRNTYRDGYGIERNRLFDSRYGVSAAVDWTPDRWSISASLLVQDGMPYTPTNVEASAAYGLWIRSGRLYNAVRYPDYVTLNARIERRFVLGRAAIAVFGDIWNILDRKNVNLIDGWSPETGDIFDYQMPRTPFVGVGVLF